MVQVSDWFGVLYREVIPQDTIVTPENALSWGMWPSQIYPFSLRNARMEATSHDGKVE